MPASAFIFNSFIKSSLVRHCTFKQLSVDFVHHKLFVPNISGNSCHLHSWNQKYIKGQVLFKTLNNSKCALTNGKRLMGKSPNKAKAQQKAAQQKNKIIGALVNKLRGACKLDSGKLEADPKKNYNLAKVMVEVEKGGMTKSTINRILANVQKQYPEFHLLGLGPNGSNVLVHCSARSNGLAKQMILTAAKKSAFSLRIATENIIAVNFEKRGVVIISQPMKGKILNEEEATDLAIEIGAEDVDVSESNITFLCGEFDMNNVEKALASMDIKPESANVEYVPNHEIDLSNDYLLLYNEFLRKINLVSNEVDVAFELINIITNFEVD